ncbi:unnamed protein product [Adineta steineri]|uniref:Uncharacterized protein n=1 Tax=Adineta steineri TaxID=433720 RepID=A0A818VYW4_9BILA|nr:unnamed protein product [Adineta steineri]CAF3717718.1 unnamed protein product [Adineta steineri]
MNDTSHTNELIHLRQHIISQCVWSDTYSSLKHILKRTANQLPLLVSFTKDNDEQDTPNNDQIEQPIFFFDRTVSNKILYTPLRQSSNDPDNQFEVYPHHCTFATTELFKGLFEFVINGQRSSRIFTKLEQLVKYATTNKHSVVFMSRDRVQCYYLEPNSSKWKSKQYPQGSFFHAQRIHRPSDSSNNNSNQKMNNHYLECLDEEGYNIFLKMNTTGRFSLIATSPDQQQKQPEIFLHSTQTTNIGQLIKTLTFHNNNNCIRLVRGSVPHNFQCQYLQLVRQHTHDVLVGLTEENLVIEWNLESHAPCRYAINLNDILNKLSGTSEEQLLESYMDDARTNYREHFQYDMQLISTKDWAAFFQYWKWTGDIHQTDKQEKNIPYQSRHRFHLVASIQDLSNDPETLSSEFTNNIHQNYRRRNSQLFSENQHKHMKKPLTNKQRLFLSEMSKLLSTSHRHRKERMSLPSTKPQKLLITNNETPFDDSIYDSNQHPQPTITITKTNSTKHNARRTQ